MVDSFHLVSISDLSDADLAEIFEVAADLKARLRRNEVCTSLAGKTLAMIFEKPSLRTRVSFEVGMNQLGGRAIYLAPNEIGLGKREATRDVARVLSGYVDGIMARTFAHQTITDLASYSRVPVINGLSDWSHPCQALADVMTAREAFGADLKGRTWTFIGDGNNVARSLAILCGRLGITFRLAAPKGYELDDTFLTKARKAAPELKYELYEDPREASRGSDVLYTDTWISMGQEGEREERMKIFKSYQINSELLSLATPEAIVMHCLPAYRGLEITDDAMDGPHSRVFDEAENRMHLQKAVLLLLLQKPRRDPVPCAEGA